MQTALTMMTASMTPRPLNTIATLVIAFALGAGLLPGAQAQTNAPRTVTLIVPYGPGGATDVVARALAEALHKQTGQTVVVDNRPGANGVIALEALSRAPRDGSVVLIGNPATNAVLPLLLAKKPRFENPLPVASVATVPGVLVASKDLPVRNVAELVAYAKERPGRLSYASAGVGSLSHLSFLAIAEQSKIDMVHVPYKGGAQALTDNLAGLVGLNFLNLATAAPLIKDGRLRALAVSGSSRVAQLPDVPTLLEQGYEGALTPNWQGVFLPQATPAALADQLAAQVAQALTSPELRAQLAAQNITVSPSASPRAFGDFVAKATDAFNALITKHKLEVD